MGRAKRLRREAVRAGLVSPLKAEAKVEAWAEAEADHEWCFGFIGRGQVYRARAAYFCRRCGRVIRKGERYASQSVKSREGWTIVRLCAGCKPV